MPISAELLNEIENPHLRTILALLDGKIFPDLVLNETQIKLLNRKIIEAQEKARVTYTLDVDPQLWVEVLAAEFENFNKENNPNYRFNLSASAVKDNDKELIHDPLFNPPPIAWKDVIKEIIGRLRKQTFAVEMYNSLLDIAKNFPGFAKELEDDKETILLKSQDYFDQLNNNNAPIQVLINDVLNLQKYEVTTRFFFVNNTEVRLKQVRSYIVKKLYIEFLNRFENKLPELYIVLKHNEAYACHALENYLIQNQVGIVQDFLESITEDIIVPTTSREAIQTLFGEELLEQFNKQVANRSFDVLLQQLEITTKAQVDNKAKAVLQIASEVLKTNKEPVCVRLEDILKRSFTYALAINDRKRVFEAVLNPSTSRYALQMLFGNSLVAKFDEALEAFNQQRADRLFRSLLASPVATSNQKFRKWLNNHELILKEGLKDKLNQSSESEEEFKETILKELGLKPNQASIKAAFGEKLLAQLLYERLLQAFDNSVSVIKPVLINNMAKILSNLQRMLADGQDIKFLAADIYRRILNPNTCIATLHNIIGDDPVEILYELLLQKARNTLPELLGILKDNHAQILNRLRHKLISAKGSELAIVEDFLAKALNPETRQELFKDFFGDNESQQQLTVLEQLSLNLASTVYDGLLQELSKNKHWSLLSNLINKELAGRYYLAAFSGLKAFALKHPGNAEQLLETILKLLAAPTMPQFMQAVFGDRWEEVLEFYVRKHNNTADGVERYRLLMNTPILQQREQLRAVFEKASYILMTWLAKADHRYPAPEVLITLGASLDGSLDNVSEALAKAFPGPTAEQANLAESFASIITAPAAITDEANYFAFINRPDVKAQPELRQIFQQPLFRDLIAGAASKGELSPNLDELITDLAKAEDNEQVYEALAKYFKSHSLKNTTIFKDATGLIKENDKVGLVHRARAEMIRTDLLALIIDKNVPRLRKILTDIELRKELLTGLTRYMEDEPVLDVNDLLQALSNPATRDQVINTVFAFTELEDLGNELISICFLERIKEFYPELYQWLIVNPAYQAPATIVENVLGLERPQPNTLIKNRIEKFLVTLECTGATKLAARIKASEAWLLLLGNLLHVELLGAEQLEVQLKLLQASLAKAADRGAASTALRNFLAEITLESQRAVEAILPADKNFHIELIAEAQLAISSSIYKDILDALNAVGLDKLSKQIDTIANVKDTVIKYFSIKNPPAKETLLAKAEQLKVELLLAEFMSPINNSKNDAQLALGSFFDGLLPNKQTTANLIFARVDDHKAAVTQATILMLSDSVPAAVFKLFLKQNLNSITLNQDFLNTAKQLVRGNENEENAELIALSSNYEDEIEVQPQQAQLALSSKLTTAIWQAFLSVAVIDLAKTQVSAWEDESALEQKLKVNLKPVICNLLGIKNNNIAVTDEITEEVWNAFTNGQRQYLKLGQQVKQAEAEQPNTLNHVAVLFETKEACEGLQALQQKLAWAELCKQIEDDLVIEANSKPFEVANAVLQPTLAAWLGIQSAEIVPAELWSAAAKQIEAALFNVNASKRLENLLVELKANNLSAVAYKIQNSAIRYTLLNYFCTTALPHQDILMLRISELRQNLLERGIAHVNAVLLSFVNSLVTAESSKLVADYTSSDEPLILEELDQVNISENGSHSAALEEVQQSLNEQDKQIIGEVRYIELLSILQKIGLSTVASLIDKAKNVLIKALISNDHLLEDLVVRAEALPEDLVKETDEPTDSERNGVRRALTHFFKGKEEKKYINWFPVVEILNKELPLNPELNYTNHQPLMAQARYHALLNDIPLEEVQAFVKNYQLQIVEYLKTHNVSTWASLVNEVFEYLVNGGSKLLGVDIAGNDAVNVALRDALSDAQKKYLIILSNEQNEAVLALLRKPAVVKAVVKYFAADSAHSIATFKQALSLAIVKNFDPNVNIPHWQAVKAALKELDNDLRQIALSQVELYAVFDLLPASVSGLLSFMWTERNHAPLLALLHSEAAAFQAYLTSNANSAEHLRVQFFDELTGRAVFDPEQSNERYNVVRDALNAALIKNAGQSLANPAANVTDEAAQDLWNEWLTEGQRKLIALVQKERTNDHNNIVAFLQAEAVALSTVLENKTAADLIKNLADNLITNQAYNPHNVNNYRIAVRKAMQAIVPSAQDLNVNLTDQAATEIWTNWFSEGMRRYADLLQLERANHPHVASFLSKPAIADYLQDQLNGQTIEVFKDALNIALASQAFDITNPEQCRTALVQARMPAEAASNEEVLAIINQFLGRNVAHKLAYNSIYHAVPIQLAAVRNWMNNNRSQACQALNPEILTPNFTTEITTAFIKATTQSNLETAIRKLFGKQPPQLHPVQVSRLNYAAAAKEGLLYNVLFDNTDIQAESELKTALQTTHFAAIVANLQPADISYDVLKNRLKDLLTTKTFNEAKNKLIAQWHLPENIANAVAPHAVALSTYKHGLEHVAERRLDLVAFLENSTSKQTLLARVADQANSNVDLDMHVWMRQHLDAMQGENSAEVSIRDAAAELLGPNYPLTLTEEKLQRNIYAANQPVTEIEQTVAPLFMRWLRSRPHLHNEMRLKTRHWSREAWEYRVGDTLKLLLEPKEDNLEAFTRQLAVATQVRVAVLKNVPTAIDIKRDLVDPDLTLDERKMLTGEARLIHWLKRTPLFAAALKKTSTWEVWARALGEIDDAPAAKTELESRLSRFRNGNDQVNLDISYSVAHTELCLAEFEKRNPALIRWFRSSPWWKKIIDTLQNYSAEQIHNILLGVSYLFARGEHKHLASLRAILNKPLDELVDQLFVNEAADEASNMFGGNIPHITLLSDLSARALFESLPDAEVGIIINSSRTALGLSKFLDSRIKNDANVNLDAVINKFKHAYKPKAFIKSLQAQATSDQALFEKIATIDSNSKYLDRTQLRKDNTALALAINAYYQARISFDYFKKKYEDIENYLAALNDMVHQIETLDDAAITKELKSELEQAKATQKTLRVYAAQYQIRTNKADRVLDRYDATIYGLSKIITQKRDKVLFSASSGRVLAGIVDDEPDFVITKQVINQLKRQSHNRPEHANAGLQIGAAAQQDAVQQDELVPGKRYVQVRYKGNDEVESAFSMVHKNEGYVAQFHHNPQEPKLFEPLVCWFKGVNTPYTDAIGELVKQAFVLSDAAWAKGAEDTTLRFSFTDRKMLQEALTWAYTVNIIRRYNGEREVPISYYASVNAPKLVAAAEKRAADLIAKKDACIAPMRQGELSDKLAEAITTTAKATHHLGKRLGR